MTKKKTDALTKAKLKYRREKVSELRVDLYQTDEDIKTHLSQLQEPKATYIKRLIREDIAGKKQSEGEWIKATPYSQEYCNQCGLTPKTIFGKLPPFCPNCGAKMKL